MASIKIHSDLYNFKRTIKGFTIRQIKAFAIAVLAGGGMVAFLWYVAGVDYMVALTVGIFLVALPIVTFGVFPVSEAFFGLPAEELLQRSQDLAARGNTFSWVGEEVEPLRGETTRDYKKKTRAKGPECLGRGERR